MYQKYLSEWFDNHTGLKAIDLFSTNHLKAKTAIPITDLIGLATWKGKKIIWSVSTRRFDSLEDVQKFVEDKNLLIYVFGTGYPTKEIKEGWLLRYVDLDNPE